MTAATSQRNPMGLSHPIRAVLASVRLTRLVVSDVLGEKGIQQPLDRLVARHTDFDTPPDSPPTYPAWAWVRDGATCPACIGFWIGLGVIGVDRLAEKGHASASLPVRAAAVTTTLLIDALALNEAVIAAGKLAGSFDPQDDADTLDADA